ncbi:MAG: class I SAM-dependent methyltransferase [Halodesulfurarchaeum sp.]
MADPFRSHAAAYDQWFETHEPAYVSERRALESLRPEGSRSLAVGVGTGRFAAPLDITIGIDPAPDMLSIAVDRGIEGVRGVGEHLPFQSNSFDLLLAVTTVCFFDDIGVALHEGRRVLEPGGHILLGFIDRESPVGQQYERTKDENPFYREATFVTVAEIRSLLGSAGFESIETRQTVFTDPEMDEPDPVRSGTGTGSFVALRALA